MFKGLNKAKPFLFVIKSNREGRRGVVSHYLLRQGTDIICQIHISTSLLPEIKTRFPLCRMLGEPLNPSACVDMVTVKAIPVFTGNCGPVVQLAALSRTD